MAREFQLLRENSLSLDKESEGGLRLESVGFCAKATSALNCWNDCTSDYGCHG